MTVKINHEKKIISIFLKNGEKYSACNQTQIPEELVSQYSLAIFYSGKGELTQLTKELLKHNL